MKWLWINGVVLGPMSPQEVVHYGCMPADLVVLAWNRDRRTWEVE